MVVRRNFSDIWKVSFWSAATFLTSCGRCCCCLFLIHLRRRKKSNQHLWRTYCVPGTCLQWFGLESLFPASLLLSHKSQDMGEDEICLVLQRVERRAFNIAVAKVLPHSCGFRDLHRPSAGGYLQAGNLPKWYLACKTWLNHLSLLKAIQLLPHWGFLVVRGTQVQAAVWLQFNSKNIGLPWYCVFGAESQLHVIRKLTLDVQTFQRKFTY